MLPKPVLVLNNLDLNINQTNHDNFFFFFPIIAQPYPKHANKHPVILCILFYFLIFIIM